MVVGRGIRGRPGVWGMEEDGRGFEEKVWSQGRPSALRGGSQPDPAPRGMEGGLGGGVNWKGWIHAPVDA